MTATRGARPEQSIPPPHREPAPHGEPAVKFDEVEAGTAPAGLAFG